DVRPEDIRPRRALVFREVTGPAPVARAYSGHPVTPVQGQTSFGSRVIGPLLRAATKPVSKSGPFPVSASPTVTAIEQGASAGQVLESYGCGMAGGEPIVNGPVLSKFVKPAPATEQPSPFRSMQPPLAPAA